MSITLTPISHEPLCHGHAWSVADTEELAEQIARVAMGQARHIRKILAGSDVGPPPTDLAAATDAIVMLTVPNGGDPSHRDGWMFQVMSWIAAMRAAPTSILTPPQMILADKGFDGLQLDIDAENNAVTAVVIFEDKATNRPRDMIREKVWPDFTELEKGKNTNLLTSEVTSLLQTNPELDVDDAIAKIIWTDIKRYRVSITIGDTHNSDEARKRLFESYDIVAAGGVERRRGDTFFVDDLRPWMQNLADLAITKIQASVVHV